MPTPLNCPEGWILESAPTTPSDFSQTLPDYDMPLSSVVYTGRRLFFEYWWEPVPEIASVQSNCGDEVTLVATIYLESSTSVTYNLGLLANVPRVGEALEITGSVSYSTTQTEGASVGFEKTVGPEPNWEFLIIPLILKCRAIRTWSSPSLPWYAGLAPQGPGPYHFRYGDPPIVIRAGYMVCRRWCGPIVRVGGEVGVEEIPSHD